MLLLFTELPGATACGAPSGELQLSDFIHSTQAVLVVLQSAAGHIAVAAYPYSSIYSSIYRSIHQ